MKALKLPGHKTKIVCTIGPASRPESVLEELMGRGMNVARLNFAHGTLEGHREDIHRLRFVAAKLERTCMILADLPGPKIRICKLKSESIMLKKGDAVTLTTKDVSGTAECISVNYKRLPESVSRGSVIYLNDGFIQLQVEEVSVDEVVCKVVIGGPLLSHKGLNLPGAKIFADTVTDRDLHFVDFALKEGVDAFSVSFVEKADDILKVKKFAMERGRAIHVVAKIERAEAVENIDEILDAADALMIARGDLGVQIPVEDVPAVQKKLIRKANLLGRPVITATQMLLSMTENIRPTRAETSDVANAILDGTDAVMLSEETAIGRYPVEAVDMMAKIAASIEREYETIKLLSDLTEYFKKGAEHGKVTMEDIISLNVIEAVRTLNAQYILTPTQNGSAPRRISRFKPDCWVLSFCSNEKVPNFLSLSYGVYPILAGGVGNLRDAIIKFIDESGLVQKDDRVILTEGVSTGQVDGLDSLKIITF
jgi:pyruvate kinase